MAAVLAGGGGAVLAGRAAGAEWNLLRWSGHPTVVTPLWRRSTPAIEFRSATLPRDEVTVEGALPITTVSRTVLDLAVVLDRHALARVVEEAEHQRLRSPLSLPEIIERHRGERGVARLRGVLGGAGYGLGVTDRELEECFVRFLADSMLPHPELNATLHLNGAFLRPDCLWRADRVIVELHSVRHHGAPPAVTRDAARDRRLLMAGYTVIHVTWAQLHDPTESRALASDLRRLLGAARSGSRPTN